MHTHAHTLAAAGEEGDTHAGQPPLPMSPATRSAAGTQGWAGPELGTSAPLGLVPTLHVPPKDGDHPETGQNSTGTDWELGGPCILTLLYMP